MSKKRKKETKHKFEKQFHKIETKYIFMHHDTLKNINQSLEYLLLGWSEILVKL